MPNQQEMDEVLETFKEYLISIENFQAGGKVNIPSDSLENLESQLYSEQSHEERSSVNPDHESESFAKLIDSIKLVNLEEGVIPYTTLTKLIYKETQYNRELYDTLGDTMKSDWEAYRKSQSDIPSETKRIFLKIKEHIGLSIIQRNHINDGLNDQLSFTQKKLNETNKNFDELSKALAEVEKEAHEKADKLVVHFITILGIFAAIMMGAFGSFQGFTSIFSNAEKIPIGKVLMISSAGASGVTLILFLLLYSISKLTEFKLSNCKCSNKRRGLGSIKLALLQFTGDESNINKCTCPMFEKYPAIFIINYFLYFVAVTGFVFMYFNYKDYFNDMFWKQLAVIALFYISASVLLLAVHKLLISKSPPSLKKE